MRLSRQFAAERVVALAFDYNGHRHQIAHAPRTKQVIQQISEFERLSGELALDSVLSGHRRNGDFGPPLLSRP